MFLKLQRSRQEKIDGPWQVVEASLYEGKRIYVRHLGRVEQGTNNEGPAPAVNQWEIVVEDDRDRILVHPEPGQEFFVLNDKGRTIDTFY